MKIAWVCEFEFCSAHFVNKDEAMKHERECPCNPKNQRCISCQHHGYDDGDGYPFGGGGWYCEIEDDGGINMDGYCEKWKPKK